MEGIGDQRKRKTFLFLYYLVWIYLVSISILSRNTLWASISILNSVSEGKSCSADGDHDVNSTLRSCMTESSVSNNIHFQTSFGNCPTRLIGNLTFTLVEEFQKNLSLLDVKKRITQHGLVKKNFLSSYSIKFDPLNQLLKFTYNCPTPLLRVLVYKHDWTSELYRSVLVENGEIYDPTYEVVMKGEKKINGDLPELIIPEKEVNKDNQQLIASIVKGLGPKFKENLSELIINQDNELTIIYSYSGIPISAFLGTEDWKQKVEKLEEITTYLASKEKIPSVINLSNLKKIVVKF